MVSLEDPAEFGNRFVTDYLASGLGGMSKRDTEILVMYLLLEDGQYVFPKDIFRACRELKLTEAKVRNLYQEVQLRYTQYDLEGAKSRFIDLVRAGAIEAKGDKVTFIVRDPLLRQYFEEWVAAQDGFTDSSFNKNLVSVSVTTLTDVLGELTTTPFEAIVPGLVGELAPLAAAPDRPTLMRMFAEEFANSAGKQAGAITVQGLVVGLKLLFMHAVGGAG